MTRTQAYLLSIVGHMTWLQSYTPMHTNMQHNVYCTYHRTHAFWRFLVMFWLLVNSSLVCFFTGCILNRINVRFYFFYCGFLYITTVVLRFGIIRDTHYVTKLQSKETMLLEVTQISWALKLSIASALEILPSFVLLLYGLWTWLKIPLQLKSFSLKMDRQSVFACCLCSPCTGTWFTQWSKVSTLHPLPSGRTCARSWLYL